MLLHLCIWLQNNSFITLINSTPWTAAALEIIHYFGMFILVGTLVVVDLRALNLAGRNQNAAQLADRLFPWMWAALALNFLSGFLMFAGTAASYYRNDVFYWKLSVILLAVVASIVVHQKLRSWNQLAALSAWVKVLALVSIVLWIGAILAGVEVPALTGVG